MAMVDYFALFEEPRNPWLDPERLKEKFTRLAGGLHPDRLTAASAPERLEANRRFAEFNTAYQILRDTKLRLQHWIELETGTRPTELQEVPPGLADQFFAIATACREADRFLARREQATSPLAKVSLFEEGMGYTDRLQGIQSELQRQQDALEAELHEMKPGAVERVEQIYRLWGFAARWRQQLQERIVKLSI